MSQHIYDYAIIGSGLAGLAIASRLSQETTNIALLDGADHSGGMNRVVGFPGGPINNGLRFMPGSPSAEKALSFIEDLLGMKVAGPQHENPPVTYSEGSFVPFVGFGDKSPEFYEEITYYTHSSTRTLKLEPYMWTQLLFEKFKGDFFPRSFITKFHHDNEEISHLTINGSKILKARNYIYCGPIKSLERLLPESLVTGRTKQRLAKSTYWTAICLDLAHAENISESNMMNVLNGTTMDEIGPSVGRFNPETKSSQWVTFVDEEASEDSEIVGLSLKKMKRQIKRAYPTAFDHLLKERIVVAPMIGGNAELKVNANMTLPGADNLWIGSSAMNPQRNLIGCLLQAQLILSSLGFGAEISTESETTHCI